MSTAQREQHTKKSEGRILFRRILGYFSSYKLHITIATLGMLSVAACTGAAAYLVKPALDDIFISKNETMLLLVPFAYIVIITIKGLGRYVQNYFMRYCGLMVLERLRNELYRKIICLPTRFYEENQVGMLMSRIINDVMLIRASLPSVVMIVRQVITMCCLIGVVFYQDWFLAIWAVLVLPLAAFPFIYFGRKLRKLSRRNQNKLSDISIFLQEIFSGIRVVKAFATEDKEAARFKQENNRLVKIAIKETVFSELSSPVMELIGAVGIGLVIWYGGKQVIDGVSTPGTFFSFVAGLVMLYDPVKSLNSANMDIQRALAGAERVFEILDSKDIVVEKDGTVPFSGSFEEIRFENLTFHYEGCPAPVLDNINLTVRQGERVAIVGPSGAGKTTFVNLIPRFYEQTEGRILLNGTDIREYTLATLRRNVAMVSQDSFLFNIPVMENIAYGMESTSEEAVYEAARAAYAHDFILQLKDGYQTVIGERGVKLSGGQKQRLTIARAILKDAPLLILDEATSALDSESERIVQKALENLMAHRTSIVIAHRLSTILGADRILVMEKGRIVSQGRHEDLLGSCPLYTRLYNMQFQTEHTTEDNGCALPQA
ncbi:lipid A ABC exporter, fused ATPase and inner membrane subunits MsbA [Oleidesulfovibrio alaskensis G20]|jgi:subfamily B ATP-binding cassette protein MsbA|uniref:Lipid A ABC exporter, fused ATPase and inner membrane subunits MsbA n=1 Tax=Oleidesulfovibrio alaskensis (strain ATCC BAA-1058 / DSM 17464 / G20) TaxID=207559 RepID=Q30ZY9_OLEA2|nr:lipid A export permease/ATP-binding protein MsbA [Oleidesulfovibrio alaskensis]ABB38757.1 lipid A ABC exporter, fused ATPase and inner membrane subunits MsbA [Oleidesulfovibrio alaskensis G20]MBG0773067.1 lipid A export permease/ATP-binding protein MsbA [Oleidesulfovibrio alaskensis]